MPLMIKSKSEKIGSLVVGYTGPVGMHLAEIHMLELIIFHFASYDELAQVQARNCWSALAGLLGARKLATGIRLVPNLLRIKIDPDIADPDSSTATVIDLRPHAVFVLDAAQPRYLLKNAVLLSLPHHVLLQPREPVVHALTQQLRHGLQQGCRFVEVPFALLQVQLYVGVDSVAAEVF